MVDLFGLIDLQLISTVSASIGVLVGVINWIIRTRRAERQKQTEIETRQAQLFMGLYERFRAKDFRKEVYDILYRWDWQDSDDFWRKYGPETNIEAFSVWTAVVIFFEGVGILVKHNSQ